MRTETIRWVLPLIHQLVVLIMSLGFVRSRLPVPSGSVALSSNIFLLLLAFRLVNALAVRTFFQPDEFFQSLEPAWQIAFGKGQGAWITWEWHHQLRSSLHPFLFASVYKTADFFATALNVSAPARAELLIVGPKTLQAVVSAIGDFYTWRLATRIYGEDTTGAWTTLIATVLNPWQWFCSTRTLSNCLETTVTIVALDLWPWQWSAGVIPDNSRAKAQKLLSSLRQCLLLAAFACILRPTNVLVWMTLASFAWLRTSWSQRTILAREVLVCGSVMLAVSAVADRLFYGIWTFPPLRFLYFNLAQSLAVFYGRNDWHYYLSQGYPLLLTTLLPFAAVGLYQTLKNRSFSAFDRVQTGIRVQLATVCLVMPAVLSLISHKEVRFIYPLLPAMHILAALPLHRYFGEAFYYASPSYTPKRLTLLFLVLVNLVIALYTTLRHASGPLSVLGYLRQQHEIHALSSGGESSLPSLDSFSNTRITAGFLMPCHSTPWRSHLVYPTIQAWALSCEPPINLDEAQKAVYRDEADQFYDGPDQFLRQNMAGGLRHLPRRPSYASWPRSISSPATSAPDQHMWPDYLVFFAQLEPTLRGLLRGSSYAECWRTFNTDWHDDWRRRGDIVVWCLDTSEQDAWRAANQKRADDSRERQFDRIVEAIRKEAHGQKKSGWKSIIPSSLPWSSSSSSFASWKRSVQSTFSFKPPSFWPWAPLSRADALWAKFRRPAPSITDRIHSLSARVSWPSWLSWPGGKKNKEMSERDFWS